MHKIDISVLANVSMYRL